MSRFAQYYRIFLDPSREDDKVVRASLARFRKIQITVAYPFLLQLFEARFKKTASPETVRATLETLENFAMRRWVCGVQTYSLQNTFTPLWKEATAYAQGNFDKLNEGVERYLCTKNYPHDEQFENDLANRRLYADGEARDKLRVLLERLEDSFEHRERVSLENTSIEHVLPQSIDTSTWWQEHLGETWFDTHEKWLHTLGNLTLTGYNGTLSNDDFITKCKILARSHFELNRSIASQNQWQESEIMARGQYLATRTLEIYPDFTPREVLKSGGKVTGTNPTALWIRGQEFKVGSWREVAQMTLETIARDRGTAFERVAEAFPTSVGATSTRFRKPTQLENGFWMETNIGAVGMYALAEKVARLAGLNADEWRVDYQSAKNAA